MNNRFLLIALAMVLTPGYAMCQAPMVTHVWPDAGLNQKAAAAHVYGDSFAVPMTSVRLIKAGYPDIDGALINVISPKYLTCSFDLAGDSTGLYDLVVENASGSDTLPLCFTVYSMPDSPYVWAKTTVGSGGDRMRSVAVGDGSRDGEMEVYGASMDYGVYQFKWDGAGWVRSSMGSGGNYMNTVAAGDGNGDGEIEVYGANWDYNIYQFKWNGTTWVKTTVGSGLAYMLGVAVGDGNHDGAMEVYGADDLGFVHQFRWNGSSWNETSVGAGGDWMRGLAVGDGNDDGEIEVYGANMDYNIYQFKWNGTTWVTDTVGSSWAYMLGVAVGDGNDDGQSEVYGACWDRRVYQFKWNGASWVKTTVGVGGLGMFGVAVGDGDGDGQIGVYAASRDGNIYQFEWDGAGWVKTTVASSVLDMRGVAVGDGNSDGQMEVYGANDDGNIYQFKPSTGPDMVLSDTTHDFGSVPVGDSLDWEYLVIKNIGGDTLLVDSLLSDTADYIVVTPSFPDTILTNDSTLVTIRFKPSLEGSIPGTLWIYSNDPAEGTVYVSLTGEGSSPGIEEERAIPVSFSFTLKSNPTRGRIIFNLRIPKAAAINLRIYDITGRLLDTPLGGMKSPGVYEISSTPNTGSGVYFYSFESPWERKTGKLVLIR